MIYNGIILTSSLLVLSELELELEVEEFVDAFESSDILTVDASYRFLPKLPTKQKHTLSSSKNG